MSSRLYLSHEDCCLVGVLGTILVAICPCFLVCSVCTPCYSLGWPSLFVSCVSWKGKAWFIACNSCITVTGCIGQYISYKFWKNGSCWILPLRRWLGYPFVRPLFLCFVCQPWVCHQVECLRLSPLYRSSEMLLCWKALLYQLSVLHGHPLLFAVLVIPDRWNNMSWRYLGKVGLEVLPLLCCFLLVFVPCC